MASSLSFSHSEALAWASAQIHCQLHASESRVALPPPDSNQPDVQPDSQTVFLPHRGWAWGGDSFLGKRVTWLSPGVKFLCSVSHQ